MQWLWRHLTYDRRARLIAGDFAEAEGPAAAAYKGQRRNTTVADAAATTTTAEVPGDPAMIEPAGPAGSGTRPSANLSNPAFSRISELSL